MKKTVLFILFFLLFTIAATLPVSAEDTKDAITQLPQEYTALLEGLPQEIIDLLPPSIFSSDSEEVSEGTKEMTNLSYLLQTVLSLVGLRIGDCAKILALVSGLLLLSAVCNAVKAAFRTDGIGRAFSFLSSLIITVSLLSQGYQSIQTVTDYFQTLSNITKALIPLMGVLYTMGGNVTAAVASASGLSLFLAVMEEIVAKSIVPFCGICLAFALIRALDPNIRLGTLADTIKKNYTTLLAFLMMLLSAMLAAQTMLGAGSDTLAMRSAKFAAGNMIPVVGGSVAELIRTVSTGVRYLRGTVGICAVILLLLTLLPTLIELFLVRLTWQLCASLADMLGCDSEKKLLDETASLTGYLITAVAICSAVVVLSISLLIHCTAALG